MEEVNAGRIAGPFKDPPFNNFKISPLSLREKSTPGKYRLLHNLSYPYDQNSVNLGIPQKYKSVKYATVLDAVSIMNSMPGCFLAKSDIASAFRIVPLHPDSYHLMGFTINGEYFYDKALPMGCAVSCAIF